MVRSGLLFRELVDSVSFHCYADGNQHEAKRGRKNVKAKGFLYGEYSEEFDRLRKSRV